MLSWSRAAAPRGAGHGIFVNMSRRHFEQKQFIERAVAITDMHDISRNSLEIEIAEAAFMEKSDDITELVKLDRVFLDASEMSMKKKAIIRNIMRMAQAIDVMVICEEGKRWSRTDFCKTRTVG